MSRPRLSGRSFGGEIGRAHRESIDFQIAMPSLKKRGFYGDQRVRRHIAAMLAADSCHELARNEQSAIHHIHDRLGAGSGRDRGA
jgi:hypothetical protein